MSLKCLQQNRSFLAIVRIGINKSQQSLSPVCNIVLPPHEPQHKHHIANSHSQKWLSPYLASGAHTLLRSRRGLTGKIPLLEKSVGRQPLFITSILAQWRHYPRLKMCVELNVCRPQESAWKPPLPQYATTLEAM
jgi:hypothetical protein